MREPATATQPQPTAEAAPAAPVASTDAATSTADQAPVTATAAVPRPQSPVSSSQKDTLQESAFLDSLQTLEADTSRHAPAVQVAREVVQQEAAALFGRPEGAAVAATWDIDVASYAQHDRVQYWMSYFTGRSRWHFERYLERAGRYDSMIRSRLGQAGLPQDMIYLAMIESGFAQNIRSRAGAVGLWQFMPETGRRYGLTVDAWVDQRRDPYLATDAAIRFLSELNNRFGSLYLAAAAYNSGPGKIQRGLARGDYGAMNGNDAYFAMADGTFLRRETRDYVPKLIAAALLSKEPERYGFAGLDIWSPLRYDSVQTDFAVGLDVVARLSHTTRDAIEELNPSFFRGVTPPDRTVWVKVPEGTADTVAARLATLPPRDRVTVVVHIVSRGETLSHIAQRYHVSVADIRSANRMSSTRLSRGQRLIIPTSSARLRSQAGPVPNEGTRRRSYASSRPTATRSTTSRTASTTTTTGRRHVVRSGETASTIAASFHVSTDALLNANGLTRRSTLRIGQTLRVPN